MEVGGTGKVVYAVPPNIVKIFLGPSAWVQGKFSFSGSKSTTTIYGPGVLDGSLFDYLRRDCTDDNGAYSLSSTDPSGNLNHFVIDGIIISDHNHAATSPFFNSTLNNVKTISWNSNNDGLRLQDSTTATNVFVRSGDDSLMLWGSPVTVINATVWQNYNGGVVNLGWLINSAGDTDLIDGLYVVKMDWFTPTVNDWNALAPAGPGSTLNGQNNAVFASLMSPTTSFGQISPPLYRNIFVEDPPQVLFSLKIIPPVNCPSPGTACTKATLQQPSQMSLNIENLYSPVSLVENSIGFQTLPAGYTTQANETFPSAYTLTGTININLANVMLTPPNGTAKVLTSTNASSLGKLATNGANVNVAYSNNVVGGPEITLVANAEGENPTLAPNTWVEIKGVNLAPTGDSRIWQGSDFVNNRLPTNLDGVSATVNGKSAYVYYISPTQVNILTPPDAMSGPVQVVLTNQSTASNSFTAQAQALSPSFFVFDGTHVIGTHLSGGDIGPTTLYPGLTTPAKPGEIVVLYANGFGPTSAPAVSGSETQSGTLSPLPLITVGGVAATVQYAGLVYPGEYQFNVVLPASLGNGDQPIMATYNGVSTPSGALITVHN